MENNGYLGYQAMLTQVSSSAGDMKKICRNLGLADQADSLTEVQDRIRNHAFKVGIMGEFKRGKSTVINALLGQEIVPADILPCSATLNRIVWDSHPHVQINFRADESGNCPPPKEIGVEELSDYVTKLTSEAEQQSSRVEDAIVYYPCKFCQDGVQIVDTPGLNDSERMDAVAEAVIPTLDAIIMVLVPGAPFSMSEASFVRNKIMSSDLGRLIFVVNKFDTVRPRDRERVLKAFREKIEDTVLEKTANVYGRASAEYEDAKQKLAGIRIYPISALDALDGKMEGDEELLKKSGMPEFEAALTRLLTEERGMLELVAPVNTIMSKGRDAMNAIAMRRSALEMDEKEFEKAEQQAIAELEESRRTARRKEEETLGKAKVTYEKLLPQVEASYENIGNVMEQFVNSYPITAAQLSAKENFDKFAEELNRDLTEHLGNCMQENAERLQVQIQEALNREVDSIAEFDKKLTADIDKIVGNLIARNSGTGKGGMDTLEKVAIGLEVATNFTNIIPGLGSAITGFRDHGILGGIVGLGAGYAATMATVYTASYATGFILASAGIAVTSVAVIPAVLIAGVVGAIGGKKITDGIFNLMGSKKPEGQKTKFHPMKESDIPALRSNLLTGIKENIAKLREERVLESWLKDTTDEAFISLSRELHRETEEALQTIQSTLTGIRVELAENRANREAALSALTADGEALAEISTALAPIQAKIKESLGA